MDFRQIMIAGIVVNIFIHQVRFTAENVDGLFVLLVENVAVTRMRQNHFNNAGLDGAMKIYKFSSLKNVGLPSIVWENLNTCPFLISIRR